VTTTTGSLSPLRANSLHMTAERTTRLTAENTNAWGHRIVGDTLVYECPDCEFGEVPVTDMIEEDAGTCLDCDAEFELFARPADE